MTTISLEMDVADAERLIDAVPAIRRRNDPMLDLVVNYVFVEIAKARKRAADHAHAAELLAEHTGRTEFLLDGDPRREAS